MIRYKDNIRVHLYYIFIMVIPIVSIYLSNILYYNIIYLFIYILNIYIYFFPFLLNSYLEDDFFLTKQAASIPPFENYYLCYLIIYILHPCYSTTRRFLIRAHVEKMEIVLIDKCKARLFYNEDSWTLLIFPSLFFVSNLEKFSILSSFLSFSFLFQSILTDNDRLILTRFECLENDGNFKNHVARKNNVYKRRSFSIPRRYLKFFP